ncbi:hypothetical protein PV04_08527 [Phialophora macrospora]|uniref:Uncharacterized protein n=1 Tax=Phialophora macrospora TaxID=1851006 RepID=A0A0D2F6J0_9EURO|nr:hypothetical protein PV04_08527 [Phialophora macrospora]
MKKKAKNQTARRRRGHHPSEQSEVDRRPSPALARGGWPLVFQNRRIIRLDVENVSFVQGLVGVGAEDDAIRTFMCGDEDPSDQADIVCEFCGDVSLDDLVADGMDQTSTARYVCWLDERALDGEDVGERARYLPLTAYGLYLELSNPRFPSSQSTVIANVDQARGGIQPLPAPRRVVDARTGTDAPHSRLFDADRRLLFVTDLNPAVIYALACTAPQPQIPALREAIYEYLASEASIKVTPMTTGSPSFKLALHLPYSVWRTSKPEQKDHRTDQYGKPLRRSQDVSYIHPQGNGPSEFLYEAHITCVISGLDDWRWVAHCFTDTYFDPIDEARDNIYQNYEAGRENGGFHMDHLTGLPDADIPVQNPREYFLKLLSIYLFRVRGEWERVLMKLKRSLREYEQSRNSPVKRKNWCILADAAQNCLKRGQSCEGRLMALAAQELDRLSETVSAVEQFLALYEVNFHDLSELAQNHPLLVAIRNELEELQRLKMSLERVVKRSTQFARNFELDLAVEAVKIACDAAHYGKMMMMYITPLALTAGIFSMNPKVIPFVPQDFGSFVVLLLSLIAIGPLVLLILTYLPDLVMRYSADRRLKPGLFKLLLRSRTKLLDDENMPGGNDCS